MFDVQDPGVSPLPSRRIAAQLRSLDRELGVVEAGLIESVIDGLQGCVWGDDGHLSIRQYVRANTDWSDVRISRCVRNARFCIDAPVVLDALRHGDIGIDRVDVLARAWANPRVRADLVDQIDDFLVHARGVSHRVFELFVRRWVTLADVDGGHRDAEAAKDARHLLTRDQDDGSLVFEGECTGAQAAVLREILGRYVDLEWRADWDEAVQLHGPKPTKDQLRRTDRQRRLDALVHMAHDAASTPADAQPPEPSVMVHIDAITLLKALDLLRPVTGDEALTINGVAMPSLARLNAELAAHIDPARLHANTGDGHALPLADVLVALILGQVRLLVEDERGVITHAGRKRRLFTGVQRELVLAAALHCTYAGCDRPASQCQADHLHEWGRHGHTDIDNGGPGCRHHNPWRTAHGYRVWRDDRGHWHTYRPDGSEV